MQVRLLGWLSAGLLIAGASLVTSEQAAAQAGEAYKLGTFSIDGRPTVGVVLRDSIVIDLAAANREYETKNAAAAKVQSPPDMKDLIVRYDSGVSQRIKQIVAGLAAAKQLDGGSRPAYVRNVSAVKTLPPIMYPSKMLKAAANYYAHAGEAGRAARKQGGSRRNLPQEPRHAVPLPEADGGRDHRPGRRIVMPKGREKIDWECEIGVVIGKPAKYVPAAQAADYIFGYTIQLDMSDRGGRPGKGDAAPPFRLVRGQGPRHVRSPRSLDPTPRSSTATCRTSASCSP